MFLLHRRLQETGKRARDLAAARFRLIDGVAEKEQRGSVLLQLPRFMKPEKKGFCLEPILSLLGRTLYKKSINDVGLDDIVR